MIPVLEALAKGEDQAKTRLSTKVEAKTVDIKELAKVMDTPGKLKELTGVDITNQVARDLSAKFGDKLSELLNEPNVEERKKKADNYMRGEYANETYILGY